MKIAVIDDERPARKMLIRRVKEVLPACEITETESGADALKMFNESDSFDLIFVDMELGDMEGTTLAATAKDYSRGEDRLRYCLFPVCRESVRDGDR